MSFADRRQQTQKRRHLEHIRQQKQSAAIEQREAYLLDALRTSRAPSLRVCARFHLISSVGGPVPIPRHQLIYPPCKHVIPSRWLTDDAWEPSHPRCLGAEPSEMSRSRATRDAWEPSHPRCLEAEPPEMPGSRATRDVKKPSHPRCLGAEPPEMSRSRATRDAWEPSHPRCQEAEPPEMPGSRAIRDV
ncbi:unnamed protein product [Diplocarpon coronariae]